MTSDSRSTNPASFVPASNRAARRWLQPETFELVLNVGGEYAGEQEWHTHLEKLPGGETGYVVRVNTNFGGVLPPVRRVQVSRMQADFSSLSYSEGNERGKPSFETTFDQTEGILTLRQNKDSATIPLLIPHYDPVSLLMLLRSPQAPTGPWRAALAGGNVQLQPVRREDSEDGSRHYLLRPGGAYVVIEPQPPYRPLRLVQPTDFGAVEAVLSLPKPPPVAGKPRKRVK